MPLTKQQYTELEATLVRRRGELLEEIRRDVGRSREEGVGALAGEVRDSADEAVAQLLADTDHAETSRDVQEWRAFEAALQRLKDGEYGTCVDCRQDIPFARLRAQPAALRCVECQALFEKTHAHPGEPKL